FSQAVLVHHTHQFSGLFRNRKPFFEVWDQSPRLPRGERILLDIVTTRSGLSMILFTFRYWLVLFTMLGRLEGFLIAVTVTQVTRWCALHAAMFRMFSLKDGEAGLWRRMREYVEEGHPI
ncbi:MAG: hypothetical protein O3B84_01740, partial [Chloroflexi bacterium]|nr:hypothetical protein [Chloroflexota bacterium]